MITGSRDTLASPNQSAAEAAEFVGHLEMRLRFADPTSEAAERWSRRSEVLAEWLLAIWRREQERA